MTDWQVDEKFLDFVVKKFESEGGDILKALVGNSQKEYALKDMVDEMRQGTRVGQRVYTTLYRLNETEFRNYSEKSE